jgi:hypothetical protein
MLLIYSLYIKEILKMSCNAYTEEPLTMVPHGVHIDFCLQILMEDFLKIITQTPTTQPLKTPVYICLK